ncbi:MAG: peptidoglycan DD-metalloendopeptidase family protein [Bacteroidota bacterium]
MPVFLFFAFSLSLSIQVQAQRNKQQLEKERNENRRRIQETSRILKEARSERKATMGALNAIQAQVKSHNRMINTIHGELDVLQEEMARIATLNENMSVDLEALREEYVAMVYAANKADSYNKLMFIFSSNTFNQFVMRLKYLQQYSEARQEQMKAIDKMRHKLLDKQNLLVKKTRDKEKLLLEQLNENEALLVLKSRQQKMVTQLSTRMKELRTELSAQLEADRKLEKLIADMVRREIRRSVKARNDKTGGDASEEADRVSLTPEAAIISNNFSEHRARLIWPVEAGFISGEFGRHKHAVMTHVIVDNLGVNIQTNEGQSVRSVFEGKVGFVGSVGGIGGLIVSITHGDYFTVYCNLRNVKVKVGDKVKARSTLGEVYTDKDGLSQIQFQVWKNTERLDPAAWLIRKDQ